MAQEVIDVVVKSAGTKRVVRDINDIADAAVKADKKLQDMQKRLNALSGSNLITAINRLQNQLSQLGQNNHLARMTAQLQQIQQQTNQLASVTRRSAGSFNILGNTALGTLRRMEHAVGAVIAVLGLKKIMEWADAWIEAAGKIRVFTKSQDEANEMMERLFAIAQNARQSVSSVANLFHRMSISASELGANQEQLLRMTDIVTKGLAVQGTNAIAAKGALLQLSQAFGSGRVRAQEFNSVLDGIPILLKVAAKNIKEAGGSVARLRQLMLDGKLPSKQFFDAILKGGEEMDALFKNAPKTFSQGFTTMVNAIERYLGKLNESLDLSGKFNQMTGFIANNLDTIGKVLPIVGVGVAAAFAPATVGLFAAGLRAALPLLLGMLAALNANPFAVLATAAFAAYQFSDSIMVGADGVTTLKDLFAVLGPSIVSAFTQGWEIAKFVLESIARLGGKVYEFLTNSTSDATKDWTGSYSEFYSDVGSGFRGLVVGLAKTADAIGGLLIGLGIGVVKVFEGLPGAINQIGARMYNFFITHIDNMINGTIEGINALRRLIGQDSLPMVQFGRKETDDTYFKNYGARIAESIDEGFAIQGNFLSERAKKLFDDAQNYALQRIDRMRRMSEKNLTDFTVPLGTALPPAEKDKAGKKGGRGTPDEHLRAALAPARELTEHYQRDLELMKLQTAQHMQQLEARMKFNRLSVKEQFIQQEMLRMTDRYEDKIQKIKSTIAEMTAKGIFDDLSHPDVKRAWDELQLALQAYQKGLEDVKQEMPVKLATLFDQMEAQKFSDDLNRSLTDALLNAGQEGASGIRDAVVNEFKKPIRTMIQAFLQPVTDAVSSVVMPFARGSSGTGISPGFGEGLMNTIGGIGRTIGGGFTSMSSLPGIGGMMGAIGGWLGGGATTASMAGVSASVIPEGIGLASGGALGSLGGALGAIGAAMPYIGIALAVASMFSKKGGGPKTESGFGFGVPLRGDSTSSKGIARSIQDQFKEISGGGGLDLGVFTATDPAGDAMTQLAVNARLNGRDIYSREARLGGIENVGRSEEELKAALTEEANRVVLAALQQSELPDMIGKFVRDLGNLSQLDAATIEENLERVKKAMGERKALEDRLFELTHTQEEIQAETRRREIEALDETNRLLAQRVHALEDEKAAAEALEAALVKAADQQQAFQDSIENNNQSLRAFLDKLAVERGGTATAPMSLANARSQFRSQVLLASSGDQAALQSITQYAEQYIQAGTDNFASGAGAQNIIAEVQRALSGLPNMETSDERLSRILTEALAGHAASIAATLNANFTTLDTSLDGALDFTELKTYFGPLATDAQIRALIARVDVNGNGVISRTELLRVATINGDANLRNTFIAVGDKIWNGLWGTAGLLATKFTALDTTANGLLDFTELKAALGPMATDATIRALIAKADTNHDGMISKEEAIRVAIVETSALERQTVTTGTGGTTTAVNNVPSGTAAALRPDLNSLLRGVALSSVTGTAQFSAAIAQVAAGWGLTPTGVQSNPAAFAEAIRIAVSNLPIGFDGLPYTGIDQPFPVVGAATGGIMTPYGMAQLTKYANGGIATSPQLAVYGEGSLNEAIIPLPDGRNVPVMMYGGNNDAVVECLYELMARIDQLIVVSANGFRRSIEVQEDTNENSRTVRDAADLQRSRASVRA